MKISTFVLLGIVLGGVVFWKFQTQVSKFLKNMTPGASNTQGNMRGWATKNIPTIILIVVGVVLLWWSHDTKVTQLGNWGKNQPLFLLVLWGFLAALIKLHTGALGKAAEVLQWVVAGGVLLALFLGSPVGEWFTKDDAGATTACKPFVSTEVRSCVLTETAVVMTAGQPTRAGEFEFCVVKPTSSSYDSKAIGTGVFQIRSATGAFPIQYKLMKGGEKCPEKF